MKAVVYTKGFGLAKRYEFGQLALRGKRILQIRDICTCDGGYLAG